ncbi:MAG: HAMP domain-containing sensor histidine kinase [Polyangiaceae bacterium]
MTALPRLDPKERPLPIALSAPRIPTIAAAIVAIVTATLLGIWIFQPSLKEFSGATMKINTTLAMLFASSALALVSHRDSPRHVRVGRLLAVGAIIIGALTLFQYVTEVELGIDELLVTDFLSEESRRHPGRMSPISATCFCLLGLALLLIDTGPTWLPVYPTSALVLPLMLVSLVAVAGYIYGVRDFYQLGPYIRIAQATALCFLTLGLGTLMARPERGALRYVANARLSGLASQRLLAAVIVLPLAFGWICVLGEKADLFSMELGTALFAVVLVVVLGTVVWIDARAIDLVDREREKSQEHLAKALRLRDEFLGIASHELKTPLTALLMQIQGVQRIMRADPAAERYEPRLERASAAGFRLEKLINELLDVSRIAEGRLRLEPENFDLGQLVDEVVGRFEEVANPADSLHIALDPGIHGRWDRLRIDQVLTNLLSNAIKYGAGKPIEVATRREANFAVITVRDHGIGIPKDQQQRIFGRFERSEQARSYGGFGLGLWIAREIVLSSGGTIDVESTVGEGACFKVRLPLER